MKESYVLKHISVVNVANFSNINQQQAYIYRLILTQTR